MSHDYLALPQDFEDKLFAENNKSLFDEYIDLVIEGHDMRAAFALVFGYEMLQDNMGSQRILCLQRNPYYKLRYKKRLAEYPIDQLWSVKSTIQNLLKLVRDPDGRDSTKLNAIRELNIIYGITMIDENGNSKMGRSMDDFYGALGGKSDGDALYPKH